jgi:hypothetical protein
MSVKISALPAIASAALSDVVASVQGGVTYKATLTQIRAAFLPVALAGDASGTTAAVVNDQARGLKSATTTVSVSAAAAPTSGQTLTATAGTTATWKTPALTLGAGALSGTGGGATGTTGANALQWGTSSSAAGDNAIAFGLRCSAGALSSVAMGEDVTIPDTGTFCIGIGKQISALVGAAVAIGENLNANGPNNVNLGFANTTAGNFSTCIGVGLSASLDGAYCTGVTAAAIRYGQKAHNGGNTAQQSCEIRLGADLVATSGVLLDAGGFEFSLAGFTAYAMRIRITGAQLHGTKIAADVYEVLLRSIGGNATIVASTALAPTGGLVAAGWSAVISVSGADQKVHITCNSGADTVRFVAALVWEEVYALTDS